MYFFSIFSPDTEIGYPVNRKRKQTEFKKQTDNTLFCKFISKSKIEMYNKKRTRIYLTVDSFYQRKKISHGLIGSKLHFFFKYC